MEGVNQIATGDLISLSEQELVDCDRKINQGCNGGDMDYAFQFIIKNGGIDSEEDYPYTGKDGKCNSNKVSIPLFFLLIMFRNKNSFKVVFLRCNLRPRCDFGMFDVQQNYAKVVSIDGYEDVPMYNEQALQKAVANQPVSVAIEAGGYDFQLYVSVLFCYICCRYRKFPFSSYMQ